MIAIDYVGLSGVITATAAAVASIVVVIRQTGTKQQIGEVHAAVSMSNGATLGQVAENIDRQTPAPVTPLPDLPKT